MPYTPFNWVAGVSPLSEFNMDHLETQYAQALADSGFLNTLGLFGDGSDGDVTTSGNVTLSRDMFYNTLTVTGGDTITTAGYRIFVKGTLTNSGTIERNGNDASGVNKGATLAVGTLGDGKAGGDGGVNGAGSAGSGDGIWGIGGDGGGGGSATAAGGAGGANTLDPVVGDMRALPQAILGHGPRVTQILPFDGGAGGGGGGGDATPGTGGGGGGGAGIMVIVARILDNSSGTIEANGGGGANGVANNGGGGGGGGGGFAVLISNDFTTGTETATGGTAGTGIGTGNSGTAGSAGTVITLDNA